MQFTLGDKREVHLLDQSVLPVTRKERRGDWKSSIGPRMKYGHASHNSICPYTNERCNIFNLSSPPLCTCPSSNFASVLRFACPYFILGLMLLFPFEYQTCLVSLFATQWFSVENFFRLEWEASSPAGLRGRSKAVPMMEVPRPRCQHPTSTRCLEVMDMDRAEVSGTKSFCLFVAQLQLLVYLFRNFLLFFFLYLSLLSFLPLFFLFSFILTFLSFKTLQHPHQGIKL